MRFINYCWDCISDDAKSLSDGYPFTTTAIEGEINSNFIIEFNCNRGHHYLTYFDLEHFDLLYLAALDSFVKGCYSESVMSFSASLERIYEFFIRTVLIKKQNNLNQIESYWKNLNNLSERQFGAFCTLYYSETGDIWKTNDNMVKFRNSVIHKGKITSKEETIIYANYVTDLLSKLVVLLKEKYCNYFMILSEDRLNKIQQECEKTAQIRSLELKSKKINSPLKWFSSAPMYVKFDEVLRLHNLFDYFGNEKRNQVLINKK